MDDPEVDIAISRGAHQDLTDLWVFDSDERGGEFEMDAQVDPLGLNTTVVMHLPLRHLPTATRRVERFGLTLADLRGLRIAFDRAITFLESPAARQKPGASN